jgi:hypothetical protein
LEFAGTPSTFEHKEKGSAFESACAWPTAVIRGYEIASNYLRVTSISGLGIRISTGSFSGNPPVFKKYHIFNRILEKSQISFYWNMICLSLIASDLMP